MSAFLPRFAGFCSLPEKLRGLRLSPIQLFWDVTLRLWVSDRRRFETTDHHHIQGSLSMNN
jgi:hypothetical protein